MDNEGTSKAPKDKNCPYCGQSFTSSSLGRHLDLYIKAKNPKAPDGLHNVEEIRKLRGSITRRQPRGGVRRASSAARDSQNGSKRSGTSDAESIIARSPEDGNNLMDPQFSRSNSQRVFNRQMMKSSMDVKQRVQDAIDTAKAAELALREMMGSWRAAKTQPNAKTMPFDFNPLSMDFPALCLQCLESPPTLFSSTPHSTSTSWSIAPPGEKQHEALTFYFREEFRKWKASGSATATSAVDEMTFPQSQTMAQQDNSDCMAQQGEDSADSQERQVTEHLDASFQVWNSLPTQRRQELWILEMARSIDKRRKELISLQEARQSLQQENTTLKSQVEHLTKYQQSKDFKSLPPRSLKMDDKLAEFWNEAGACGRQSSGSFSEDRRDLNAMVSGAIERWKSVIVSSRAANANNAQRALEEVSSPLKTPTSAIHPLSPEYTHSTQQQQFQRVGPSQPYPRSSPNQQHNVGRNASTSSAGQAASAGESKTSTATTPAQSLDDDSDEDADADADVEMEGGDQYLPTGNAPTHHTIPQMVQHHAPQQHQMHAVCRPHDAHVSAVRHNPYPQRSSPYGAHSVLPSQQMHMSQQAFGHQLQSLEHHLAQGHASMGWSSH